MRIDIDGLEVLWPYDYIYPEQLQCQKQMDTHKHAMRASERDGAQLGGRLRIAALSLPAHTPPLCRCARVQT